MYPPEIIAGFSEFKAVWDPDDRMNPGRVVRPATMDEDLRVFVGMPTIRDEPMLAFGHDRGSFTRATRRCLGVGKCAVEGGGVMCPSYRVTREEKHSTRGRARLLFEMANGEVDQGRLAVRRGRRGAGPVPVLQGLQVATARSAWTWPRTRPSSWPSDTRARSARSTHYSMGALPLWLWMVGALPAGVVDRLNRLARRPKVAALVKKLGGIAPEREIPEIARETFTARAGSGATLGASVPELGIAPGSRGRVLLWTDTFTDHFDPVIAGDAVATLTALGYTVELPPRAVCCGLTWTSTGQVGAARRVLGRSLRTIGPWLTAGVPVVGLEPSCTAALRCDASELLPDDPLVERLETGVRTFAELLAGHAEELSAVAARRTGPGPEVLVQVHCHQHAELGTEPDRAVLDALGVRSTVLDSGCCGLAGNFGFEDGHYDVSMACAERVLLPAVRAAGPSVDLLADGFSCRTQVRQAGEREPVHLAQLAARVLRGAPAS